MPRPTHILTWLMLAMLVGGHWGMLQMVGWAGMLIDYSRDATFAEAWEKTFDGDHPCVICKQVDRGIAADLCSDEGKAPGKLTKTIKLDAVVTTVVLQTPTPTESQLPVVGPTRTINGITWEPLRRPPRQMV